MGGYVAMVRRWWPMFAWLRVFFLSAALSNKHKTVKQKRLPNLDFWAWTKEEEQSIFGTRGYSPSTPQRSCRDFFFQRFSWESVRNQIQLDG
ncbi:MAG: hypothetical protein BYD32DRAFT_430386 [Podila humilis]|nr:MAG: hypothetical protein BYD32DRAFT_430386 [Podila humilis]